MGPCEGMNLSRFRLPIAFACGAAHGGYSGYFIDPEGFRWEVAFNPHPIGDVTFP